jgi:iron-sulfur cluster repair protein YtfE (RIC family)
MALEPNKDACELLDADHIAVKHLFVAYARLAMLAASPQAAPASDDRLALAMKICDELTVHAQIEEEIFYPALQEAVPETADQVEEAQAEHQQGKEMIAQIRALGAADETMDDLVAQLNRAIEHHVKEERDEMFPKARAAGLDLVALGAQLRQRQQVLEGETAPAA